MGMKAALVKAVNHQIQHEQNNAHAYHAVSLYFRRLNLHGFAAFMAKQAGEERAHADKLIAHLVDRGAKVELAALPAPDNDYPSVVRAVAAVHQIEQSTTALINKLTQQARKEGDLALEQELQWFIKEQVEEEAWSQELEDLVRQFANHPGSLFMLDHRWGKRVGGGS